MATTRIHDAAAAAGSPGLFRAALVAGAVFLLWKGARGLRDLGWTAFGLGMAAYWTGFWPF
jgi:hypothetical protein